MYIESLELDNFKSFGFKKILHFKKGFTIISGPNGSGKSNIGDAFLFVLGTRSSKTIRVDRLFELIHKPSQDQKQKNYCRVSITIDSEQENLPEDARKTKITRELVREGEEYKSIESICEDSSGNAGASVAAYGRSAGFAVKIYVPSSTAGQKLSQIEAYGADINRIEGSREQVAVAAQHGRGIYASHVYMPEFRDGIRTLAYEIYGQFGKNLPQKIFVPTSAGTLLSGLAEGFIHLMNSGLIDRLPSLVISQPELMAPFCRDLRGTPVETGRVRSIADALVTINSPLRGMIMKRYAHMLDCIAVSESEIIKAHRDLAGKGVLTEFSSAVASAAWNKAGAEAGALIILTGNGLKNL